MEPRIQYAQTKDGVSIAYWTLGEGMPLFQMPFPFSHLQLDWEIPEFRACCPSGGCGRATKIAAMSSS